MKINLRHNKVDVSTMDIFYETKIDFLFFYFLFQLDLCDYKDKNLSN